MNIELTRSLAIAAPINGNRCDQSYPRRVKTRTPARLTKSR
jgi:hypothetical protein